MLRIGFLAAVLAGPLGVSAMPASTTVSLESLPQATQTLRVKPSLSEPFALTGLPKSLDGLLSDVPAQDNAALCDSIRSHVLKDGTDLPFDAASIVEQALGQGLCPGESG